MKQYLYLLVLLASACNPGSAPPTATETIPPTETTIPDTPTATSTPRPPTQTPTSTPDFDATAAAIAGAVMTASPPRLYDSYLSPDEQWRVDIMIYDCVQLTAGTDPNAYEELRLIEVSTGDVKVMDSQLLNCGGLGAFGLEGRFWSPNSRYFYYTDARESWPDGGCGYWERPLIRLDLADQSIQRLDGGPLSPDGTKLAMWEGTNIVIWDLDDGEIARAPAQLEAGFRGPIAWSPDGESLVYLQTEEDCNPFARSYMIRLELPELNADLLLESESLAFTRVTWDDPDRIELTSWDGNTWRYEFESGELEPVP